MHFTLTSKIILASSVQVGIMSRGGALVERWRIDGKTSWYSNPIDKERFLVTLSSKVSLV